MEAGLPLKRKLNWIVPVIEPTILRSFLNCFSSSCSKISDTSVGVALAEDCMSLGKEDEKKKEKKKDEGRKLNRL